MKKSKMKAIALAFVVAMGCYNLYSAQQVEKSSGLRLKGAAALAHSESGTSCRWKTVHCSGPFSKKIEVCINSGDGNPCNCGDVTRNCN